MLIYLISSREIRGIVYVPFTRESIRGLTPEEICAHMEFKRWLNSGDLSAATGPLIALGSHFSTSGVKVVADEFIAFVAPLFEQAMSDVVPCDAIVLWFARQVR